MTTLDSSIEIRSIPVSEPVIEEHTIRETLQNAMVITTREMRDSFRDWRIMVPIFVLTLIFPALAQGMTGLFTNFFVANGAAPLIENFLPLLPMVVGFFPISISLVIALETFVGEKERRSLEPLLSTPLTNTELYIGKTLAATIPPLLASYIGMGIYLGGLIFGTQQWRPEPVLILQIMLLTTAQALVMVTGAVVVSSQTTSTRASNLLASFIIIPMSMLVMLESFIMITNNRYILWYILIGIVVADVMLLMMGARIFNREDLLGRAIDQINLKWAIKQFWFQFTGGAKNIVEWYRIAVFPVLPKIRLSMLIVIICMIGTFVGGYLVVQNRPDFQLPYTSDSIQYTRSLNTFERIVDLGVQPSTVLFAIGQNLRVLIAAMLLGIFTFGVMAIFFSIVPFGVLGFLLGQPIVAVLGLGTFVAAVLPHSLVEVPAILISTAAAARLGAVITRPPKNQGVWDVWLVALADWVKVFIGLVMPLLIIAALIEVYITPRIIFMTLGQ